MNLGQAAARMAFPGLYKHEQEGGENKSFNDLADTISDHDKSPPKVARALVFGLIRNYLKSQGYNQRKVENRPRSVIESAPLTIKRHCTLLALASLEFSYHNEITIELLSEAYTILAESGNLREEDPALYDQCLKAIELATTDMRNFKVSKQNINTYLGMRLPMLEENIEWLGETSQFNPLSVPSFTSLEVNVQKLNLKADKVIRVTDYPEINSIFINLKHDMYF